MTPPTVYIRSKLTSNIRRIQLIPTSKFISLLFLEMYPQSKIYYQLLLSIYGDNSKFRSIMNEQRPKAFTKNKIINKKILHIHDVY